MFALSTKSLLPHHHHRQYSRDRSNSNATPSDSNIVPPTAITAPPPPPPPPIAPPPAPPSSHSRRFSTRSNSVSSSIVTIRRSTSLTSKSASNLPATDPSSPDLQRAGPAKLQKRFPGSGSNRSSRRHSSIAHLEGVGSSLNRYSHSTSSSKSSAKEFLTSTGTARQVTATHLHGPSARLPPTPNPTATSPPRKGDRSRSPVSSPQQRRNNLASILPPLPIQTTDSLPILTSAVYNPNETSSSLTTPTNARPPSRPSAASTFINAQFDHGPPQTAPPNRPPPNPTRRPASPTNRSLHPTNHRAVPPPQPSPTVPPQFSQTPQYRSDRRPSDPHPGPTVPRQTSAALAERYGKPTGTRIGATGAGGRSASPVDHRDQERRERDKKTMLSRALQKANTAVVLDNAQNFEGAVEAYEDACKLLRQVMQKTSGDEDRKKLDAIRVTYTTRIRELKSDSSLQPTGGKSLPARPMSDESLTGDSQTIMAEILDADDQEEEEQAVIATATMTRIVNDPSTETPNPRGPPPSVRAPPPPVIPPRRESAVTAAMREVASAMPTSRNEEYFLRPGGPTATPLQRDRIVKTTLGVELPMDRDYMPPPLSPRRPMTPKEEAGDEIPNLQRAPQQTGGPRLHDRGNSEESISWLDTVDESPSSSCASSVHSMSQNGIKRKHLRNGSGGTEAEFDAALDAAVEAAYDEGFEPYPEPPPASDSYTDAVATVRRNIELAKEKIREVEREEAISEAHRRERQRQMNKPPLPHVRDSVDEYHGDDADEEERILDEMTKEYMLDGFDFGLQSKSALPRQSDSSEYSGKTWHSSVSSKRTTGGMSLSTVSESTITDLPEGRSSHHGPRGPGVAQRNALSSVSESNSYLTEASDSADPTKPESSSANNQDTSIKDRRKSAQNTKGLTIETSVTKVVLAGAPEGSSDVGAPGITKPEPSPYGPRTSSRQPPSATFPRQPPFTAPAATTLHIPSPSLGISPSDSNAVTISPATPLLAQISTSESAPVPPSPSTKFPGKLPGGLRKNKSSISLKNRAYSISSPDEGSDGSVNTPISATFSGFPPHVRKATLDAPGTVPAMPPFPMDAAGTAGMHLFESDIHSPYSPGTPNPLALNAPIPLEPCPDSYLLRPFWLMRCFYQTIAHPRGGYLSTKLFVPRDVWRVKGVKVKSMEEKIANCDLLTAALLKLGAVDTFDSEAVLDEMQSFEFVLDQVQTNLVKKLGSDVGMSGVTSLWKDVPILDDNSIPPVPGLPLGKSASGTQSKGYLTSWRKLRSKNTSTGLGASGSISGTGSISLTAQRDPPRDGLVMPTLPMTSLVNPRFAKRDVAAVDFSGPNANYTSALARLFDAVQVVDQVARQVEDPGLRHSNPTYVGLELCARHAAEFFGFYVCRFVLADMSILLDKFVKRGSEWVLV